MIQRIKYKYFSDDDTGVEYLYIFGLEWVGGCTSSKSAVGMDLKLLMINYCWCCLIIILLIRLQFVFDLLFNYHLSYSMKFDIMIVDHREK